MTSIRFRFWESDSWTTITADGPEEDSALDLITARLLTSDFTEVQVETAEGWTPQEDAE